MPEERLKVLTDMVDNVSLVTPWDTIAGVLFLGMGFLYLSRPSLPVINGMGVFELRDSAAKKRFLTDASSLIRAGFKKAPIFQLLTDNGYRMILAPKYANEIKSLDSLSFGRAAALDFHTHIAGFEPFRQGTTDDQIFQDANKADTEPGTLGGVTIPLSMETAHTLQQHFTDNTEWHTLTLKPTVLEIVAQLSSKVFLGDELCRDPNWLRITSDYTVNSFIAAEQLSLWPWIIRPIVARFLPVCRTAREDVREAREIITPVLERRRAEKQLDLKQGKTPKKYSDAMKWMEQTSEGRPYDAAIAQLFFSLAAIHTTTDMLTQALYNLVGKDQLIQDLRNEIITVFKEEGWKKPMLFKLKLMDSTIKESQRLKPISDVLMRRLATSNVRLSDGSQISRGDVIMVSGHLMWDPEVYSDPETFDVYRFLKLRDTPGHETSSQLVSPSPEHMGLGLGKHACPGRFFAANEVKIALCHILLKYDLKAMEGSLLQPGKLGFSLSANSRGQIAIRRRKEEVEL